MDTSRVDGVKAPQHRGTPRSRVIQVSQHERHVARALEESFSVKFPSYMSAAFFNALPRRHVRGLPGVEDRARLRDYLLRFLRR